MSKPKKVQRASDWNDARWCQLPPAFVTDLRLTLVHVRLLGYIGRVGKSGGWCEFSQKEAAQLFGVTRKSINVAARELVDWGYFKKKSQQETKSAVCHYKVILEAEGAPAEETEVAEGTCNVQVTPPGGGTCNPGGYTRVPLEVTPVYPHSSYTHLAIKTDSNNTPPTPSPSESERVCAKWGTMVEELWTEKTQYRYVVELLVGPLHARKQRAKGIEVYAEFLRSIRDGIGERDFAISVLERAFKALDASRTVMPGLPEVLAACERAQRDHEAERKAFEAERSAETRRGANPETSDRTEPLRERLRHRLGREVVTSWFADLVCESFAEGCLTVSVGTTWHRNWIDTHFVECLRECAEAEFAGLTRMELTARDAQRRRAA